MIWSLKIPPKIKSFLWRAALNIIPTCNNLNKKHVMIDYTCPVYRGHVETVLHVFVIVILQKVVGILLRLATIGVLIIILAIGFVLCLVYF